MLRVRFLSRCQFEDRSIMSIERIPKVLGVCISDRKLRTDYRRLDRLVLANGTRKSRLDRSREEFPRWAAKCRRYGRRCKRLVKDIRETDVAARCDGRLVRGRSVTVEVLQCEVKFLCNWSQDIQVARAYVLGRASTFECINFIFVDTA